METYYNNDPKIQEWIDQIIEKLFTACLLSGADADSEFARGTEVVQKIASCMLEMSDLPPELLFDGLQQLLGQRLPDTRVIDNFPVFYEYMDRMIKEGILATTGDKVLGIPQSHIPETLTETPTPFTLLDNRSTLSSKISISRFPRPAQLPGSQSYSVSLRHLLESNLNENVPSTTTDENLIKYIDKEGIAAMVETQSTPAISEAKDTIAIPEAKETIASQKTRSITPEYEFSQEALTETLDLLTSIPQIEQLMEKNKRRVQFIPEKPNNASSTKSLLNTIISNRTIIKEKSGNCKTTATCSSVQYPNTQCIPQIDDRSSPSSSINSIDPSNIPSKIGLSTTGIFSETEVDHRASSSAIKIVNKKQIVSDTDIEKLSSQSTNIKPSSSISSPLPKARVVKSSQIPIEAERLALVLKQFFPNSLIKWNLALGKYSFLAQVEKLLVFQSNNPLDNHKVCQEMIRQGWRVFCCASEDLAFPRRLERGLRNTLR
ncbi:MAG: hypothetical protein M0T74_06335 [Desulfitobacterium hafniense]|nr:hypothetical protein [Desulfitobacterium hafniense]